MANTLYEVLLFAEFVNEDSKLERITNRLTLTCESSQPLHCWEVLFEPLDAAFQRDAGTDPVTLTCGKDLLAPSGWTMYSHLKPEPERVHPEATVRPATTCNIVGDALGFASALGFRRRYQLFKRGVTFKKGILTIQLFQMDQTDPKTRKPVQAHASAPWQVEVKSQLMRNVQETPLSHAIEAVLEVQLLMKGLLDLARRDSNF